MSLESFTLSVFTVSVAFIPLTLDGKTLSKVYNSPGGVWRETLAAIKL